jgi:Tfp pilus assembly protein PilF
VSSLSVSGKNYKPERVPLDALVTAPANIKLTLDTARPEEVQALALLTLSQLYLDRGDAGQARARLTQALSRPPSEADAQAALNFYMGYIYQVAESPEPDQAVVFYSRAIDLAPEMAGAYLNRAIIYIQQNKPAQWQPDLARVLTLKPDSVSAQGALCWGYALDKQPDAALPHCNEAVTRDPTPRSRDARGVVYAELGRLSEAADDFGMFLSWLGTQPESLRSRYAPIRGEWIEALKAGTNPIDSQTLAKLRTQ